MLSKIDFYKPAKEISKMETKTCPNDGNELKKKDSTHWECKHCGFHYEVLPSESPITMHWHEFGLSGTYGWEGQV